MQDTALEPAIVKFHGIDVQDTLDANPDVKAAVMRAASTFPGAKIDLYTAARYIPDGPLEWTMSITSPAGRRTLILNQRAPGGAVSFSNG